MRSQEKKQIWLLDDLTDKAIQQRLSMLGAMLSEFRVRLRISVQHLSELMDVHKSCFSPDSPRPDSKVSSTVKYLFAMLELNGMHLHTESLLDLIRQCRNERKELIIRIAQPRPGNRGHIGGIKVGFREYLVIFGGVDYPLDFTVEFSCFGGIVGHNRQPLFRVIAQKESGQTPC